MKIFGHPLHVILIHFPSALFPMDLVCSIFAYNGGPASLTQAAFFASAGGVLLGILAAVTGALDLVPVVRDKPRSAGKALIHGGINGTVVIGFFITTYMAYKQYPAVAPDRLPELVVKGVLVLLLAIGNFLGGSLILHDRIGVRESSDKTN